MEKEIKVVAYARVSSKEQAEKELSIPAQLEAIRNYCKQKGWKLVHEYIDAGKSAKTDERPEFQRMVAIAKRPNRGFDAIIVHKIDRFSRNRDDHVIYKTLLKKLGVTVYSVTEQADPETPHGFLLEGIMEVVSEFYNMNLKNEAMKGMRENAKRGYHNGGQAPYGYRTDVIKDSNGRNRTVWVLGPDEEVNTVRKMYDLYVRQNKGYKAIVSILNQEGIPSQKGKLWSWSTIWHILHNEAYIGQKVWNKHDYGIGKKLKPKDEWVISADAQPAIIDRETFYMVSEKSKGRDYTKGAFKSTGPSLYLLRGMLKCPDCEANMVAGLNSKSSRGKTRFYICGTYHRKGTKACNRNNIYKEDIEKAVINILVREFSLLGYPGAIEEEVRKYYEHQNREILFQIARIDDEIVHVSKRIKMLESENSDQSKKKFLIDLIKDMKSELGGLQKQKVELNIQKVIPALSNDSITYLHDRFKYFISCLKSETPEQQHIFLKEFIVMLIPNRLSGGYKLIYKLEVPSETETNKEIILAKTLFFN